MVLKQINKFFFLLSLVVLLGFSCSPMQDKQGSRLFSKQESLNNSWTVEEGSSYAIQYPKNWTIHKTGEFGTAFFLSSPLSSKEDNFNENISLIIQNVKDKNIDLDEFVRITEQQIMTLITEPIIEENARFKKRNNVFHKLVFSGKQGLLDLVFEQQYCLVKDKAYVLTFTCKKNDYEQFKSVGEEVLNSFELRIDA